MLFATTVVWPVWAYRSPLLRCQTAKLTRCKPQLAAFELADASHGYPGEGFSLMVYCRSDSAVLHARMFGPLIGISEDPATGSAAAALAALLAGSESKEFVLHQGADMGRPSVLQLRVQQRDGWKPQGSGRWSLCADD